MEDHRFNNNRQIPIALYSQSTADDTIESAFETLGMAAGATAEEIKAAHHRMAQQYHPDKVATLAPEFRELAERRMKEISAAHEVLRANGFVT